MADTEAAKRIIRVLASYGVSEPDRQQLAVDLLSKENGYTASINAMSCDYSVAESIRSSLEFISLTQSNKDEPKWEVVREICTALPDPEDSECSEYSDWEPEDPPR